VLVVDLEHAQGAAQRARLRGRAAAVDPGGLTVELRDEITALLAKGPDCNGYAIPRKNHVGNVWVRHGGMYPSAQLRLFCKGEFKYDELAEVHPQAYMKDPRGTLKGDILHYTYRDFTDMVAKLDRQTDLEARKWFREKRKVGMFSTARKMADRFWRQYVKKEGRKDGVIGLFLAVNGGMYQFLSFAKYWEMKRAAAGHKSEVPFRSFDRTGVSDGAPVVNRETISAVIMTKDCESFVEGTLKSVAGWVDEIVVIDGFSKDRTVDICKKYGAKIVQNKWDGYRFCTERNLGTRTATSDWCLHVDPDERATPELRDAVLRFLEKGTKHAAFEFRKKNYFLGRWMRHGGWYHYSLHLFRRTRGTYEGVIHESLKVDGSIGRLEAAVEHYPFTSISQFVNRHNGYSSREAQAAIDEKKTLTDAEVEYELKKKPLKRFSKFYFRKGGFLEGTHGFIFSVLFAWVHFLNWAKYWELRQARKSP